ncbi:M14 family zinc carboxypeptidase [Cytobacillus firmus]|uniref:M14 family zinc carboxypeptidase n=1 Tax=Cytobacillus firmus TaxID=1399 RepID=UPI0021630E5A|nr:M14 family zinc carboxypeptidase [Cytobacillus firmus]MCS0674756.1 M14 family zinc carboxypeptidase [Cytobacillus firmus]
MKKKSLWKVLSSAALAAAILVPQVGFAEGAKPVTEENVSINGFVDYEELKRKLSQIEKSSNGLVQVESAGKTNQGRDIFTARVGHGDKVVLVQSEIHGNEKTGTVALLNILQYLGSSQSADAKRIREELTIVAIPMMNADGSEMDRRGNVMTWEEVQEKFPQLHNAQPTWNYYTRNLQGDDYAAAPGFDVNRDFNPDLNYVPKVEDFPGNSSTPGWYITPESQTVRDVYKSLQKEFGNVEVFLDLHHQNFYKIEGTDEDVTMSISADFVPDPSSSEGAKYSQYAENYRFDFSRQLNVALYDALQEKGNSVFTNISLYDQDLDLPGTALGSFALNGSGVVLFEVKGQTHNYGQKMKGQLVKTVETGVMGIINGVADGSVYDLNPDEYNEIPNRVPIR